MPRSHSYFLVVAVFSVHVCFAQLPALLPQRLTSGTPANVTLAGGALTYFAYSSNASFSVDVVPLAVSPRSVGRPIAIWVSNATDAGTGAPVCPNCTSGSCDGRRAAVSPFQWSSFSSPTRFSAFAVVNPFMNANVSYCIAVWSPTSSIAIVTAIAVSDTTILVPGVPTDLVVPAVPGTYVFATTSFNGGGGATSATDVVISATAIAGAVDIFASGDGSIPLPQSGSAPFSIGDVGDVSYSRGTLYLRGANISCTVVGAGQSLCSVYVGLRTPTTAPGAAQVTLVAALVSSDTTGAVVLLNGRPQAGALPPSTSGATMYYTATVALAGNVAAATPWNLALTPSSGNPAVYVSRGAGALPSSSSYDWSSATDGPEFIAAAAGALTPGPAPCGNCTYTIAVVAPPSGAAWTLWFTIGGTNVPVILSPFTLFTDVVPIGSGGRQLLVPAPGAGVDLRIDASYVGFPPMQFALDKWTSNMPLPPARAANGSKPCRVILAAQSSVAIGAGDACACNAARDNNCGYAITALCGGTDPSSSGGVIPGAGGAGQIGCGKYPLTVAPSAVSTGGTVPLLDGQSVVGAVAPHKYAYYTFVYGGRGAGTTGVVVTLSPRVGAPQLFATNSYIPFVSPTTSLPDNTTTQGSGSWSALAGPPYGGGASLSITADNLTACATCTSLTVGVYGGSGGGESAGASEFSILAQYMSAPSAPVRAIPHIPSGSVDIAAGSTYTFEFELAADPRVPNASSTRRPPSSSDDLMVTVTTLIGTLYMSLSPLSAPALCVPNATVMPGVHTPGALCGGVWATNSTRMYIAARAPCAGGTVNPPVAAGARCNASNAWVPGATYYLNLWAAGSSPARASVLVSRLSATSGEMTALLPGLPVASAALVPATPSNPPFNPTPRPPSLVPKEGSSPTAVRGHHNRRLQPPPPPPPPRSRRPGESPPPTVGPPPSPQPSRDPPDQRSPAPPQPTRSVRPQPPSDAVAPPAVYTLTTTGLTLDPVTFTVRTDGARDGGAARGAPWALRGWITSCRGADCRGVLDGNASTYYTFSVGAHDSYTAVVHAGSGSVWCGPNATNSSGTAVLGSSAPCVYALRLAPHCPTSDTTPCLGGNTTARGRFSFDVSGSGGGGKAPVVVPPVTLSRGGTAYAGALVGVTGALYSVYTGADVSRPPVPITLRLEAGGPIFASAYICDPTLQLADPYACSPPYDPGAGAGRNTAQALTALANGFATLTLNTSSPLLMMRIVADNAGVPAVTRLLAPATTPSVFRVAMAAGVPPPLLVAPMSANASIAETDVVSPSDAAFQVATITWAAPLLQLAGSGAVTSPLPATAAVRYRVYWTVGYFYAAGAMGSSYVVSTPAGLGAWASATSFVPATMMNATSMTLPALLLPNTTYAINVVATCDAACLAAAVGPGAGPTQSVAYTVAYFTTGFAASGGSGGGGGGGDVNIAIAVGAPVASLVALVAVAGAILFIRRRRSKNEAAAGGAAPGAVATGPQRVPAVPTPLRTGGTLLVVPNPLAERTGGVGGDSSSAQKERLSHLAAVTTAGATLAAPPAGDVSTPHNLASSPSQRMQTVVAHPRQALPPVAVDWSGSKQ